MANRVNVNITARDLTGGELRRMRRNFASLGQDIDRAVSNRTRQNFDRLRQSLNQSRRELQSMRGAIPDAEFFRLDEAARRAQRTMQRGFGRVGDRAFQRTIQQLRTVQQGFNDLDQSGQIRVRVDTSALRRADALLASWRTSQQRNAVRIPVRPQVNNHGFRTALMRPLRALGGFVSGTLSDGVGQGLIGGVRAAGPILGPILAASLIAAVVGAMSLLGAAIAGALVLAIGGAFVAAGVMIAMQSKKVKQSWADTLSELKPLFVDAASAMLPVIEHARQRFEEVGKAFAPHFKEALAASAPHVTTFMDHIIEGFKRLGGTAAADLEEAFNVFLDAFGPDMEGFLAGLGDSLGALARTVRDNSSQISGALTMIISLITTAIDIINFFANAWVDLVNGTVEAMGSVLGAVTMMVDGIFAAFEMILTAAENAFSWVPGVGDKLAGAREAFTSYRDSVVGDLSTLSEGMQNYGQTVDNANRERILKVNIQSWKSQLAIARQDLKTTADQKAEAKVRANIADLTSKIASARAKLDALNGKTVTTFVRTAYMEGAPGPYAPRASGGVVGTAATGGVRSNMTLVGEQGPEIVDLAPGSHVRSNPDSRRLMAQGGQGGGGSTLVLKSSGRRVDDMLIEILREAIHQRGGDPVAVLGG